MNGILLMHIDFITLLCLMIYDTLNDWICCYVTVVENIGPKSKTVIFSVRENVESNIFNTKKLANTRKANN